MIRRLSRNWLLWPAVLLALTAAMYLAPPFLEKAHIALLFLLVVLGGSAAGGRTLGVSLALASFFLFNFFFIPPYHTFVIANPLDWLVLLVFLATGIVAAQLLYRAQAEAAAARLRAEEVDRLASLGAETLNVGRSEDALAAVARVIRTTLGVAECEVLTVDAVGEDSLQRALDNPRDERSQVLRLVARGRTVGVLRLSDPNGIELDPAKRRFLEALAYYAALGVERVRLSADAERSATLVEADRLKDALLASVSHDIRTPLTTIRALAHDIAAEGDERALVIEEEALRLNRFVGNLLDLSRLSAGTIPLSLDINVAEDLIGAALQRIAGIPGSNRIRASIDPRQPLLAGRFDFTQSLRILVNLIENALKYAPADSDVDVVASRDADSLVFRVSDRGPGVPAAERSRIFTPFYRVASGRPDVGGTGLGLAIAHGLALAQGGSLSYEPRTGGGSEFALRFPAADLENMEHAPGG
jgi:two-component system sensor histidine kinase KdpD